jgi:hypothetical protein
MANGASKIPSFHTDFKNVNLILVKSAPQKVLNMGESFRHANNLSSTLKFCTEIQHFK